MGRRLLTLVGVALAVGLGVPPALAWQDSPPPPPPATLDLPEASPAVPDVKDRPEGKTADPKVPGIPDPPASPNPPDTRTRVKARPGAPEEPAPMPLPLPGLETVPRDGEAPAIDPQVKPSEVPVRIADVEKNPLPPAQEAPGAGAPAAPAEAGEYFVLPPERVPLGKQAIALTVDVQSPPFLNLNQEATLRIVVKNTGDADAIGVVVRDKLPDNLSFLSSQPIAQNAPGDPLLVWRLGTVGADSEKVITVRVKPTRTGPFDHAATVTLEAGSKSRSIVQEPKLKVEQTVSSARVLKGQPVEFKVVVQNIGDGPARDVVVHATLSQGLRHESGEAGRLNEFSCPISEPIQRGQRVVLEPFVADTVLGGEQTLTVVATSPDVNPGAAEAKCTQAVTVVEPKLKLTLTGPSEQYTEMEARYDLTAENPGTATARKVKLVATLPLGVKLVSLPPGAQYDPNSRRLLWSLAQLEPKETKQLGFDVHLGGPGLYQVSAETRADGGLYDKGVVRTDVKGIAVVRCAVRERKTVVGVGASNVFEVKIANLGTKDATGLLVKAELSEHIKPVSIDIDSKEEARFDPKRRLLVFPLIDHLERNKSMTIAIKVEAVKPGQAGCHVNLVHDKEADAEEVESTAYFRVTPRLR